MTLPFTILDALIVLTIVVSAGYAAWRGFIWETLTVFAWLAAAFGCLYFGPYVVPLTHGMVQQEWLGKVIAYAAVFLLVFIPFAFLSHRVSEGVKHSPIGPLDRAGGIAFGVVRGLVIVGALYLAGAYYVDIARQPDWVKNARLLPYVQSTSQVMLSILPNHTDDYAFMHHGAAPPIEQQSAVPPAHDPVANLIQGGKPAPAAKSGDSVADLINHDGAAPPKTTPEPVPHKSSSHAAKSAGTNDRQRLNDLFETGGKQ